MRVGIIGAGPSGLALLRALATDANPGAPTDVVCFEKQAALGGLWNYSWRSGVDEWGEPAHGSMYQHLWSNAPKECLEFADYSFDEHFGRPVPSYPPRPAILDYIQGRAEQSNVTRYIRFNSVVRWVEWDEKAQLFTVTVHDHVKAKTTTEEFSHVVVASGHFSTPNSPSFPGLDAFPGAVLHAHDFKDATQFKAQRVLLVGNSYSGEDIGSQLWKFGAAHITTSFRSRAMGYTLPDNWDERPSLLRVDGNTAHFKDGTSAAVDAIILCTGYKHFFNFLPDDLRLETPNRLAVDGLYKGVVWAPNPRLFYMGMEDQWLSFTLFDAQAWWIRDALAGRIAIPADEATRVADAKTRQAAEEAASSDACACVAFQAAYMEELAAETDYPPLDMDVVREAFAEWKRNKKADLLSFRDACFTSAVTGTKAPPPPRPWKEQMDDTTAVFLA